MSVDDAARAVAKAGRGAFLAKADIKQAYRMVPVHPADRLLLGMVWEESLFVDSALPFGLRSAPKIFNALADALEWLIRQEGLESVLHYLDDFLIVAESESMCRAALQSLLRVFARLEVPIAPDKLEGPSTVLTFLGIEMDTVAMSLRLPAEKLTELRGLVARWEGRSFCTLKELESLAGKLQHACKVVKPGRTFMRRMFELMKGTRRGQRFVRLNVAFRSDLAWWHLFMARWNGRAILASPEQAGPRHHLFSDASGVFGCGAMWGVQWFQLPWPQESDYTSIAQKELIPVVIACILWGRAWSGQVVVAHCDNTAAVEVINSGYSKDSIMMHLLRTLFFVKAHWELEVQAEHIPGRCNGLADAISRNKLDVFFAQAPQVNRSPTVVLPGITRLLISSRLDWTSPAWSQQLVNCLMPELPTPQGRPIEWGRTGMPGSARGLAGTPSR